jgi:hypothetical protein
MNIAQNSTKRRKMPGMWISKEKFSKLGYLLDSSVIVYQEVSKRKLSTGLSDPV